MTEAYDAGPVAALRRIAFLLERAREDGTAKNLHVEMPSTVRVDKNARRAYEEAAAEGRTGQFLIEQREGNAVLLPEDRPAGLGKAWR